MSPRHPVTPSPRHLHLGRFGGGLADQVVLTVRQTEPVPWVEVHCHGGREVVRLLLELLKARGVQVCTWQQFEERTSPDPWRAQATVALAQARTQRVAALLLAQQAGAFGHAVEAVLAALDRGDRDEAGRLLADLCRFAAVGRHLTTPWKVTVAGAPNVGKSSLVNALAGFQRSVVADQPGTTRDVVTTLTAVDGWPVELADTAGLRGDAGALEDQGIRQASDAASRADLCLWVLDASAAPVRPPASLVHFRLVVNKVDLPPTWDLRQATDAVHVSAQTGAGLAILCDRIASGLVPDPPPPGTAVPFTPELGERVEEAKRLCDSGRPEEVRKVLTTRGGPE